MTPTRATVVFEKSAHRKTRTDITPHTPNFNADPTPERKEWNWLRNKRPQTRYPELNNKTQLWNWGCGGSNSSFGYVWTWEIRSASTVNINAHVCKTKGRPSHARIRFKFGAFPCIHVSKMGVCFYKTGIKCSGFELWKNNQKRQSLTRTPQHWNGGCGGGEEWCKDHSYWNYGLFHSHRNHNQPQPQQPQNINT